jgi:glycosyltransferase involved in cell wall biosynthesis
VLVTVVVPARNAEATIARTLAALAAQRVDHDYELIVVDSGSKDATRSIVAASPVLTALLDNPGGEPAGSRNIGVRHARGTALAFTDADCEPADDWLAAGLRALADADIVQGRVIPARPPKAFDRTVSVGHETGLYETANLFVRREVFERVGGFEPVLDPERTERQPFGEDAWFAWRARRSGAVTRFAADAVVRHAVFERGARGYIAERSRCGLFPPLVARIPELRAEFLHRRVFLSMDSARFDLAVAGLLAGALHRRRAVTLAPMLPYAAAVLTQARRSPARTRLRVASARVAGDAVAFAALLRGSLAARTLVL